MSTNFPTSIDSLQRPVSPDTTSLGDNDHSGLHDDAADAIEALEAKVGVDGSDDTSSLDYKTARSDEHLAATSEAHPAGAITTDSTGRTHTTATDVETALDEIDAAITEGDGVPPSSFTAAGSFLKGTGAGTYEEHTLGAANTVVAVNAAGTDLQNRDVYALPQSIDTVQVESFTVALDQVGQWVPLQADDTDDRTVTLPQDSDVAVPVGTSITFEQLDSLVEWEFAPGTGATVLTEESVSGNPRSSGQGAIVIAFKKAANTWRVSGSLVLDDFLGDISQTGVWGESGADTGQIEGGALTASTFTAEQTYTQTEDPLPRASGGTSGVFYLAKGQVVLDYTGEALVGPVQASGYFGPRAVFSNEIVQIVNENQDAYGHGPVGFMSSFVTKNTPGEARTIVHGYGSIMAHVAAADGATVTLKKTDVGDGMTAYVDNNVIVTAGSGAIDADQDNDYTIFGFKSAPVLQGNVTLSRRVGFYAKEYAGGVGSGSTFDGAALIGGNLSGTVDNTAASVATQIGVLVPRYTKAAVNIGISCDSQVKLWSDTVTFSANPTDVVSMAGTFTFGTGADLPPRVLSTAGTTLIVDTSLNAFAVPAVIYNNMTYKSAANSTVRDLKQMRSFFDNPIIQADTSADTMANLSSFHSSPTFSRTNSGTLAVTDVQQFYADAAASGVGAGVTVTTWRGLRVANQAGSGTITNAYGIDVASISKGGTKNRAIRIGAGGIEITAVNAANETSTTNLPSGALCFYLIGTKLVFAYNNSGTIRYSSIDFSGNGNSFTATGTSAP